MPSPDTLEKRAKTKTTRRRISIGLPRCSDANELRFPLTPEGVKQLVESGLTVKIQTEGASTIHYTDEQYTRCGAAIVDRAEALMCDVVICLGPLTPREVQSMRRGALLLTNMSSAHHDRETLLSLLEHNIITIAIELIEDYNENKMFADALSEIDGRAAIAIASSLLADAIHGKGILLGGVAGVIPCEVTVIGAGIAGCAAARSAAGAGAVVHMFDNDIHRLRLADRELGSRVVGSSLHRRVLESALRSADVVVATDISTPLSIDSETVRLMKTGVITFDLTSSPGAVFPSLPAIDLASAASFATADRGATRVCYINAGSAVPRTAAMAMSNAFITLFSVMDVCDGVPNTLKLVPGLQKATLTFFGKAVNASTARLAAVRHVDISIYLTIS